MRRPSEAEAMSFCEKPGARAQSRAGAICEVRRTKDEITKYKLRSTVAARLFASGIGASISHTCPAPLSFWKGAGGEARSSSAMCQGHSWHTFPRLTVLPTAHDSNRGAESRKIYTSFTTTAEVTDWRERLWSLLISNATNRHPISLNAIGGPGDKAIEVIQAAVPREVGIDI